MAKLSVANRNKKRILMVQKDGVKRSALRTAAINPNLSDAEREIARLNLQKMPRDTSPCRRRNRCSVCSRPRAYNRLTGLCRMHMRSATLSGIVPGMHKASW